MRNRLLRVVSMVPLSWSRWTAATSRAARSEWKHVGAMHFLGHGMHHKIGTVS